MGLFGWSKRELIQLYFGIIGKTINLLNFYGAYIDSTEELAKLKSGFYTKTWAEEAKKIRDFLEQVNKRIVEAKQGNLRVVMLDGKPQTITEEKLREIWSKKWGEKYALEHKDMAAEEGMAVQSQSAAASDLRKAAIELNALLQKYTKYKKTAPSGDPKIEGRLVEFRRKLTELARRDTLAAGDPKKKPEIEKILKEEKLENLKPYYDRPKIEGVER